MLHLLIRDPAIWRTLRLRYLTKWLFLKSSTVSSRLSCSQNCTSNGALSWLRTTSMRTLWSISEVNLSQGRPVKRFHAVWDHHPSTLSRGPCRSGLRTSARSRLSNSMSLSLLSTRSSTWRQRQSLLSANSRLTTTDQANLHSWSLAKSSQGSIWCRLMRDTCSSTLYSLSSSAMWLCPAWPSRTSACNSCILSRISPSRSTLLQHEGPTKTL